MKRIVFAITVLTGVGMAGAAFAGGQQAQTTGPTRAEIEAKAMQDGPATPRIGYLTRKEPVAPHRAATPVDPKMLRPLTQREIGMLYNACIAYAECKTAYSKAYEHNQALLKAKEQAAGGSGQ